MFDIFKIRKMSLYQGLYNSTYILSKYRKEDALRGLSKKQLEKVTDTLEKEMQFNNSKTGGFLSFFGLILVVIFFIISNTSTELGGVFLGIDDITYQLESVDVKMIGEEYNYYPGGVTGTYKIFKGYEAATASLKIASTFYLLICLYYLFSIFYTQKLHKVYTRARYIRSLK